MPQKVVKKSGIDSQEKEKHIGKRLGIVNGPSKFDLMENLFCGDFLDRINLFFVVISGDGMPQRKLSPFFLTTVERLQDEDHWRLEGFWGLERRTKFTAMYFTNSRNGWLEIKGY